MCHERHFFSDNCAAPYLGFHCLEAASIKVALSCILMFAVALHDAFVNCYDSLMNSTRSKVFFGNFIYYCLCLKPMQIRPLLAGDICLQIHFCLLSPGNPCFAVPILFELSTSIRVVKYLTLFLLCRSLGL